MQETNISVNNFEQCVKCSICVSVCPMMEVNPHYPGPKQAGPDGERYRLKDPAFFDLTLKYCLNCKRCEVACPSGVKVGDIIQMARMKYGRKSRPLRDRIMSETDLVGSVSSTAAPVVNGLLSNSAVKSMLHVFGGVDKHRTMPSYSPEKFTDWFDASSQKGFDKYVTYFHGCYVNYNYPQLGKDLVRILNACGYGVHLLADEKCCGVSMITNGFGARAAGIAKHNVSVLKKAVGAGGTVLTSGSTCTFTMRDEYDHLLGVDTTDVRNSIVLATKWLRDRIEDGDIRLAFRPGYSKKITYHTACHMQKLGWSVSSTSLLKMIPGVELSVPEQHCCGIAGTFGFKKENYPYSQKIGEILFSSLRGTAPDLVVTECETCKWQIEMSTDLSVSNPLTVLAEALDFEKTKELNCGK